MKHIKLLFLSFILLSGCHNTPSSFKESSFNSSSSSYLVNSSIIGNSSSSLSNVESSFVSLNSSSEVSSSTLDESSTIVTSSSIVNSSSSEIQNLNTPSLTIDENGVVTFNKIDNALYYEYIINAGEINTTFSNVIEINDKENISVRAVNDYSYSEWSNVITYYDTSDIILEGDGNYHKVYFHDTDIEPIEVLSNTKNTLQKI